VQPDAHPGGLIGGRAVSGCPLAAIGGTVGEQLDVRPAETLQQLYEGSYRRLVAQLAAMTGDVGEAEDLVQEAFARAVGRWETLRRYDNPEAWLRTVAMNLARSRWRRATRGTAVLLRLRAAHEEAPPPSPDHVTLVEALRGLPATQREALVLFHIADLSVEDIARQLGVPSGTVKARLSRGRAALAEVLRDDAAEVAS
jgi:RNA polymerase sigma-70 factor (ECF subfamily)